MKKTLRSLALVAMAALPVLAGAQLNVKTVWANVVENGVANPIPGLDAGWTKPTAAGGTSTDTRFATGKDGKILINNHKVNEIQSWDGKSFATVCKLPTVTDKVWNGTALSTDDAGNVVLNFGFTDPTISVSNWAVLTNGVLTEVQLSTPLADLKLNGRLDIISHIVGDVTSAKGGYGYATIKNTDHLVMFHFTGDGTKVTKLTAEASSTVEGLAALYTPANQGGAGIQTETYQAAPKFLTVDDIEASVNPADEFYLPIGKLGPKSATCPGFEDGVLANYDGKLGNRGYGSVATMVLDGTKYIIRNYVADDNANADILTNWKMVMQFGIFTEDGTCVATWEGSTYTNSYGSETYSVEMVNEKTANIYAYIATGNDDAASGTVKGAYAAMVTVSTEEIVEQGPDGTAANPYIIATVDDLCRAWSKVEANQAGTTYFIQTEDIDMAGVTDWHAINGFNGTYTAAIYYDGQNHLIKNFSPTVVDPNSDCHYYMGTVFGVLTGTVKNLGIVDANVTSGAGMQGGGFLAAYAGHSAAAGIAPKTYIENVFVTGKYDATGNGNYIGGLFGTTGSDVVVKNCFVNAEIIGENTVGGFIGRQRNAVELNECYVAGSVKASGAVAALLVASDKTPDLTVSDVAVFNKGLENVTVGSVVKGEITLVTDDNKADVIDEMVDMWEVYTNEYTVNGLPGLVGFTYTSAAPAEQDGTEAHPYIIATVDDLCRAWSKVEANQAGVTYFVQTADIDMEGVTDWHAINGFNGTYTAAINYDGQNHLIKNFSPTVVDPNSGCHYYMGTVFGVLTGTVKNLGIVEADVISGAGMQGGGFLAAYAGHSAAAGIAPKTYIENVFVTGNYDATGNGNYIGGLFGTTGSDVVVKNCFVNANIIGENTVGGFIGRQRNAVELNECYVAGSVKASGAVAALLVASDKTPDLTVSDVAVFNKGLDNVTVGSVVKGEITIVTDDNKADVIDEMVDMWEVYTNEYTVYGLPGLVGFTYSVEGDGPVSGINTVAVEDADAPAVYYNLQGVQVANPENGLYIVRRGNKVTKELICK